MNDQRPYTVGLKATRLPYESWRDCVIRNSAPYGLEEECLSEFDRDVAKGVDGARAAWDAMYSWDLGLEIVEDGDTSKK